MTTPKRFSNGVTNVRKGSSLGMFPAMDPTLTFGIFKDFFTYAATDWVATATSVGTGTSAAAMSDTETGGAITITNAANDNDSYWLQYSHDGGTNDSETFKFATGKKAWFKARFKGNDVDKTDYIFGLHITATDPIDTAPTDGVWFQSDSADGDIDFHVVQDSVYTSASAVATMADDTYITVGFYFDGLSTFTIYINDVEVATTSAGTLPDDETLALSFGAQNGEATANTCTVDFVGAWMER